MSDATKKLCCANQVFERHPDPAIADIGHGGGAEFTIGTCKSCGSYLMHMWIGGGMAEGVCAISAEQVKTFTSATDAKKRKKLLSDWFNTD